MTTWEAYQAGKAAGAESYLRDFYNSAVTMHLACSQWIRESRDWPVDARAGNTLRVMFRQGWDVGAGGEVVEA